MSYTEEKQEEFWKSVVSFNGIFQDIYEISNFGRVRSKKTLKLRSLSPSSNGYIMVLLYNKGFRKGIGVHRLVAEAFLPNPENKPVVHHKNHIRNDNCLKNLEWVTPSENYWYAVEAGRIPPVKKTGKHICLNSEKVQIIKYLLDYSNLTNDFIGKAFDVKDRTIIGIKYDRQWSEVKYNLEDFKSKTLKKEEKKRICSVCKERKIFIGKTCSEICANKTKERVEWDKINLYQLRFVDKLTYKQIAEIANCTESSVIKRMKKLKIFKKTR